MSPLEQQGQSEQSEQQEQQDLAIVLTIFPTLPIELRRMIWRSCLPGPRVITIVSVTSDPNDPFSDDVCRANVPGIATSLLHTSTEAREVALKSYAPFFHSECQRLLYMDFKSDILNFANEKTLAGFLSLGYGSLAAGQAIYNHDAAVASIRKIVVSEPDGFLTRPRPCVAKAEMRGLESVTLLNSKMDFIPRKFNRVELTQEEMEKVEKRIVHTVREGRKLMLSAEEIARSKSPTVVFLNQAEMDMLLEK